MKPTLFPWIGNVWIANNNGCVCITYQCLDRKCFDGCVCITYHLLSICTLAICLYPRISVFHLINVRAVVSFFVVYFKH